MSDIEFYIMQFKTEKQIRLMKIRSIVFERFPDATERIYYGIPTIESDGKIVLHYAAYKNHVSLIIGVPLTEFLKEKYPQYRYTEYTVIFPDKEPFPEEFVKEIIGMLSEK